MAVIDDLLSHVSDDGLRTQLSEAVAHLRRRKKFGLVFEEHIPETVVLPAAGLREGSAVMLRCEPKDKTRYIVESIAGAQAKITAGDGTPSRKVGVDGLLVLKPFGEPVYPVLRQTGSIDRNPDLPYHAVINGENFHALQLLLFAHEGQVDCIYIDPPYNTGARDWKYNNAFVDAQDSWRHSKWLSFMEKRLRLAKKLLKPDGVLIITIDEHEVHHLGVLLAQVFPEYLRHMVSVVINPKGTGKVNFGRVDEYAFFVIPDTGASLVSVPVGATAVVVEDDAEDSGGDEEDAGEPREAIEGAGDENLPFPAGERAMWELRHARRRGGESSYRSQRPNQFYALYVDESARRVVRAGPSLSLDEDPDFGEIDGLKPIWPIDREGNHRCWRYVPTSMQELIDGGFVVMGRHNAAQDTYTVNYWVRKTTSRKPKTVWWHTSHDAGTHGTTLLHAFLGRRQAFNFPKSIYAVRDALALVVRNRPDALIVDFFAGSGTTLHAAALLNTADGGRRRVILVTNNEVDEKTAKALNKKGQFVGDEDFEAHGIAHAVTIPRVQAALSGVRQDGTPVPGKYIGGRKFASGLAGNAAFFDLCYEDADLLETGTHFDDIVPLLWLAAGCYGDPGRLEAGEDWLMPKGSPFAVLLDEDRFRGFLAELAKRPDIDHVWLVTDSENAFARMRSRVPAGRSVGMLYRDYLRNFRINARVAR